jgi:hypothetical protein
MSDGAEQSSHLRRRASLRRLSCLTTAAAALLWTSAAHADTAPSPEQRESIAQQLEEIRAMREALARQMQQLDGRIGTLENQLQGTSAAAATAPNEAQARATSAPPDADGDAELVMLAQAQDAPSIAAPPQQWGGYEPGPGFVLARTSVGELNFGMTSYARYLDQTEYDATSTDAFGRERDVLRQNNVLLAKGQLNFRGWIFDPRLNYLLYVWTQNAAQGLGAQVAVAGNLSYRFNPAFALFAGIHSVPSTRTTNRTFPMWLRNDNRTIADEYFRGSYTSGVWAEGTVAPGLQYRAMVANNLSTLGVDAGQLSPGMHTFSGALTWMPTTHEFGPAQGFGDLERHQELATLFGLHYTVSRENAEAQPNINEFENTQLHLSDGTLLFAPNAFNTGGQVTEATYQMLDVNGGFKYRGWSLDLEYYWRWIDDFDVVGPVPVDSLYDHGFQLNASGMMTDTLQAYVSGSMIFGEYGDPSDVALGLNWFPFQNRNFRINAQALYVAEGSPVGYLSYILPLGAEGWGFNVDTVLVF